MKKNTLKCLLVGLVIFLPFFKVGATLALVKFDKI
jgi:hypothetical protein